MSVHPRPDVAVVGAGVVGAACAEALAREGLRVTVVECGFAGGGATGSAMGHLVVMDDSLAQLALTRYSVRLWEERAEELPPDVEYERRGTLWIASTDGDMERARERATLYISNGVSAEVLSPEALEAEEPNLRKGLAGALLVPDDRVLYPPAAARWLLARAEALGAVRLDGVRAHEIGPRAVRTSGGRVDADIVVNAAGIGAPALTQGLPVEPRKGHLVITDRYPGVARRQLIELGYLASAHGHGRESVAFNLQPRATGQLLLGSSREFVGLDASVNRPLVGRMVRRALEFLPALARLTAIRTWVGFRPCTPDNLPLVGAWPEVEGLYVAAGHEGLGVTTSLGTARLLADLILGRMPAIDAAPYAPARVLRGGCNAG